MEESLERRTKMETIIRKEVDHPNPKVIEGLQRDGYLLQHALHFLKAKYDGLDEDHHAPREEDSLITPVAVSFSLFFAFCRCDVESLTVLAQTSCPAARAHTPLIS
jgi:hypothetical protein